MRRVFWYYVLGLNKDHVEKAHINLGLYMFLYGATPSVLKVSVSYQNIK